VLVENVLYQCAREADYQPNSAIELGDYTINNMDNQVKRKFTFGLFHERSTRKILGANDQDDYDTWIVELQKAIEKYKIVPITLT
jgi:hypothetical protein